MAVFFVALAINIKVTLDDPFAMVNEKALAEETTSGILEVVPTECKCVESGKILGPSQDCTIGASDCEDLDCQELYSPSDCEDPE